MGMPQILINFYQKAVSAISRSQRGIATIIVRDDTVDDAGYDIYKYETDIKASKYSTANATAIKRAFICAVNKVIVVHIGTDAEFSDAVNILEGLKYNYVCAVDSADQQPLATYIISKNANSKGKKYCAVVYNATTSDSKYVINMKNPTVTLKDGTVVPSNEYTVRICSLLANMPMNRSCTFYILQDLASADVSFVTLEKGLDEWIDDGYLVLYNDEDDVRIARGVNSLQTLSSTETEDMKKIIIVESMNIILEDIYNEFKDNYVGHYKNSYDNQCLFISAVNSYFRGLQGEEILDPAFDNMSTIDVVSQRNAWTSIGKTEAEDWSDAKVKEMSFKSTIFLAGDIKILDAVEDLHFDITME